ncbi:putative A32 virion packaging ATPase [Aureococcus anophagefferens virus]|uniref:Putative A32 virion packaging ATPase n=1 Tax=Aureococcus anophagefferens virus TaxID=1474867 RepID=A0A076FHC7_9VIRU|nr:putative A32 virion packaging ATPase [Aureococcus anophagefferens virus]AII17172.1 putative A32 virion packaging ATPase [Aureococcus anophagefferens virus]UOG94081.1 adenyl ribonucleotide binding [Aureococcus anophagefferens virus]
MKLQLKKFDMGSIAPDSVVVMIGKRNTGKSFLTKDLLSFHTQIPVGTVVSATEAANSFYSEMVPPVFIHNEYSEDIVQKVLIRQEKLIKKQKLNGYSSVNPNAFVIFDDCLYDSTWTKSKYVRSLFMNGRHFKILFIITMQYALGIPPNLRTNIDYVFILRENIIQNRKRLFECFAGMFPSFDAFCSIMDQCTNNYECLVIDNTSKSNKIEDCVFWYKANPHPPFKLCSQASWDFSNKNYKPPAIDEDDDEMWDPNQFKTKTNKPKINVSKYNEFF